MKRIQTLETRDLAKSLKTGGCGECRPPAVCCKTSCGLATSSLREYQSLRTLTHEGKLPPDRARSSGTFFIRRK